MGQSLQQRNNIAYFVRDAVEMETAIYTLGEMEKETLKQKETVLNHANQDVAESKEVLEKRKRELLDLESAAKEKPPTAPKCDFGLFFRKMIVSFLLFLIPGAILMCIVGGIISGVLEDSGRVTQDTFLSMGKVWGGGAALAIIAGIVRGLKSVKEDFKVQRYSIMRKEQNREEAKLKIHNAQRQVHAAQNMLKAAEERHSQAQQISKVMDNQIVAIRTKHAQLQNQLLKLYQYGIIPPDYRYMDCVIMLDQIFRNNLADDMRAAILLYEERVYRGEVIRGMDKIVSMLGRLSNGMEAISYQLNQINSNVVNMSNDLTRFNANLEKNQSFLIAESQKNRDATEELISETRLGRYATEQLQNSADRLNYYAEEYRMGRMPNV